MHHWGVVRVFLEGASERGFEGYIGFQQIVMGKRCPKKHQRGISLSKKHGSRSRKPQGFTGRSGLKAKWSPIYERLLWQGKKFGGVIEVFEQKGSPS